MADSGETKTMLSIWLWVGIVLLTFGLIITGMGVYYVIEPEEVTVLGHLNPSLWWGGAMDVGGIVFLLIGRKAS